MTKQLLNLYFLFILSVFPVAVSAEHLNNKIKKSLTEEDIVNLVKPAVVRLGQHITGKIILADADIDLLTLELKSIPGSTVEIELDKYYTGSGFFVNSNGYIATNAHVVSKESIKSKTLKDIIAASFMLSMLQNSEEDVEKIQKYTDDEIKDFADEVYVYLMENSIFDLEYKTTMVDPRSIDKDIKKAIDNGIPVDIIYSNDNFFRDRKDSDDIAIVKIKNKGFPALPISLSDDLTVGAKIYVIGFPGNAQAESNDFLESTFTTGSIGSKKKMGDGLVWQVDAKISGGSSGGPMVNKDGEVVGIVSFQTADSNEGDNFAFVIPSLVINEALNKIEIENKEGNYNILFKEALGLKNQGHCGKAAIKFESAKNTLSFIEADEYVDMYIDECKELIRSGQSVDTKWDEFMERIRDVDLIVWIIIVIGVIATFVFITVIIFLKKRLKMEEKELKELEGIVVRDHYQDEFGGDKINSSGADALPISSIESDLIKYVKDAKASDLNDDTIKKELKDAGWSDDEIKKAFNLAK